MSWNYRVLSYNDGTLGVHEVYYDDANDPTVPTSCTEDAVGVVGDDLSDLRAVLEDFRSAFDAPVLDYDSIVKRSS